MFTGLIAELGRITAVEKGESSAVFTIAAPQLVSQIALGDSVAVNGVCLTATAITGDTFTADVMVQTLNLTSLAQVEVGTPVNLELAAQMDMRMGGHIVQGHVDGVGEVVSREKSDNWDWVKIRLPKVLMKYVVHKGSITLDGISLTVNEIDGDVIALSLIPETLRVTTLGYKNPGDKINVEADVLAKHVEKLMESK